LLENQEVSEEDIMMAKDILEKAKAQKKEVNSMSNSQYTMY
jgi:hypothetical protein